MSTPLRIPLVASVLSALSALVAGSAHAQLGSIAADVHPMMGLGLSTGGDTVASVKFTNGKSKAISAGGLVDLRVGGDWRPLGKPYSAQVSIGYFADKIFANNGSVTFQRIPIEVLGYYNVVYPVRVGGGLRLTTGAKLTGSGAASTLGSTTFKTSPGLVLETEYLFHPHFSMAGRLVAETYKAPNGTSLNGSHVGLRLNAYY